MRTIEQAISPYGPAICPRCLEPAVAFFGRYKMICGDCYDECCRAGAPAMEDATPAPEPVAVG